MNDTVNCFISTSATGTTNTCSNNNGGCEDVCFPTPEGSRCGCEEGFILRETSQCSMATGEFIYVTRYVTDTLPHGNDTNTLKPVYRVTKGHVCRNEHRRNVLKQLPFSPHAQQRRYNYHTACRLLHFTIVHAIR